MKVAQEAQPASLSGLYDEDFFEWTRRNAELVRAGEWSKADVEHIAEEIEDMGRRDRREIENRMQVLLTHLLKWWLQPAKRSRSWRATIAIQRDAVQSLLSESPSLRSKNSARLAVNYKKAAHYAEIQTGLTADQFPAQCPFTIAQILDPDFLP